MPDPAPFDVRSRIIDRAAALLEAGGPEGLTTRAVAAAAGTQAPTIYRIFGDKDGLLEAVAEQVMATHVARKADAADAASSAGVDPVEDLAASWRAQVEFGLAHPEVFRLLSDPERIRRSAAALRGWRLLEQRVHRVAAAGRLHVGEARAVHLLQASVVGTVQTLLTAPPDARDAGLPDVMLAAVLARMITDRPEPVDHAAARTAVAFRALVPDLPGLSEGERGLLAEWVDRAIAAL